MHNCHSPPDLLGFAHICKILISLMVVVQFSWRFLSPISDREHHLKLAFEGSAYPVRLIFLKREIRNTKVRLNRYFRPPRFEGTSFDVRDIFLSNRTCLKVEGSWKQKPFFEKNFVEKYFWKFFWRIGFAIFGVVRSVFIFVKERFPIFWE